MRAIFFVVAVLAAPAASAEGFTALDLQQICKMPETDYACIAYVRGFADGFFIANTITETGVRTCVPSDSPLDYRQARQIVEKYMADHPEKLRDKAPLVMMTAFASAFPCSGKLSPLRSARTK